MNVPTLVCLWKAQEKVPHVDFSARVYEQNQQVEQAKQWS